MTAVSALLRLQDELASLTAISTDSAVALSSFTPESRPFQALVRASFRAPVEPPVRSTGPPGSTSGLPPRPSLARSRPREKRRALRGADDVTDCDCR